jgi:hypothetical protein
MCTLDYLCILSIVLFRIGTFSRLIAVLPALTILSDILQHSWWKYPVRNVDTQRRPVAGGVPHGKVTGVRISGANYADDRAVFTASVIKNGWC